MYKTESASPLTTTAPVLKESEKSGVCKPLKDLFSSTIWLKASIASAVPDVLVFVFLAFKIPTAFDIMLPLGNIVWWMFYLLLH